MVSFLFCVFQISIQFQNRQALFEDCSVLILIKHLVKVNDMLHSETSFCRCWSLIVFLPLVSVKSAKRAVLFMLCNQIKTKLTEPYYCISCQTKCCVCVCVSTVMVQQCTHRPTGPTETKRVRLRVRLIAPSLVLFPPPRFFLSIITFLFLNNSLKLPKPWPCLSGGPCPVSMVTIEHAPVASPISGREHWLLWKRLSFFYFLFLPCTFSLFSNFAAVY